MADTTLYPTADAFVNIWVPDGNYGAHSRLISRVKIGEDCRAFLKFDLSSLPPDAILTFAKLRCYVAEVGGLISGVTDVQARRVAEDSWVEDEITWNNQPDYGTVEDTNVSPSGWVEWDVTSFVQNEWAGDKVVSICLKCIQESYDDVYRGSYYFSKDYDGNDPELYIEYTVPVKAKPSSIVPLMRGMDLISAVKPFSKRFPKFKPRLVA